MPIKFACPKCKNVMQVDERMAGKTGKCKCGNPVQVPKPTASNPSPAASGGLASVFDELTEKDYNRSNPYQHIYAPPKVSGNDGKALGSDGAKAAKKVKPGQLTGILIFVAVVNILSGLASFGLAIGLLAVAGFAAQLEETTPLFAGGVAIAVVVFGMLGAICLAGSVGIFLKQAWGWLLLTIGYVYAVGERIVTLVANVVSGFEPRAFFSNLIPAIIAVLFCAYMFRNDTRAVFGMKTATLPIIAIAVGLVLVAAINGILFALGAFTPADA